MRLSCKLWLLNHGIQAGSAANQEFDVHDNGVLMVDVAIKDSPLPTDTLIFDTGSKHTWVYHSKELRRIRRGHLPANVEHGGFRTALISRMSLAPLDGRHIKYADNNEVRCDRRTRKEFAMDGHKWEQKFGIAFGNEKERAHRFSGLIGAEPGSHFAMLHPQFGFRPVSPRSMKLFLGPIDPTNCEGGKVGYVKLASSQDWTIHGSMLFGNQVRIDDINIAVDTGASLIALPHRFFSLFKKALSSSGIRFSYKPDKLKGVVDCRDLPRLPPIEIHASDVFKISIPYQFYATKNGVECVVRVASVNDKVPVVLGRPVFVNFVTEFDSINQRIGICQPLGAKIDGQKIEDIPVPALPEPIQEVTQPPRLPDNTEEGPFDDPSDDPFDDPLDDPFDDRSSDSLRYHLSFILALISIFCM